MSDDLSLGSMGRESAPQPRENQTLGSSTIYRLCEEVISLRERNTRQHTQFERSLKDAAADLKTSFNSFAADTQRAYQQLRQETVGEKKVSLALLNELLEIGQDLEHIVAAKPSLDDVEALKAWAESIEVESRKVQAALLRHGIFPYEAKVADPYDPKFHERVGKTRVEGMGPNLVAEVVEKGYASQQPDFVLRRPKVKVSE
jgi:molecular chaperone GrpE (heat shock protein)